MSLSIFVTNRTKQKIDYTQELVSELYLLCPQPLAENAELSILYCGDKTMKQLNSQYRNKLSTTDVLSFPSEMSHILGDIVISVPQAKKQAKHGFRQEIELLLCHGLLHLLGYDHESSPEDFDRMMNLQSDLLHKKKQELYLYAKNH